MGANATVSAKVLGVGGVPSTGVAAVVVHVTGVTPTLGTYLTAFGTGYPKPVKFDAEPGQGQHRLEYRHRAGRAGRRRKRL